MYSSHEITSFRELSVVADQHLKCGSQLQGLRTIRDSANQLQFHRQRLANML